MKLLKGQEDTRFRTLLPIKHCLTSADRQLLTDRDEELYSGCSLHSLPSFQPSVLICSPLLLIGSGSGIIFTYVNESKRRMVIVCKQ